MLRAGTQTGSLTNHMYSRCKDAIPKVGEGGTLLMWTDSHAVTIVEVSASGKRLGVKRDKAKRVLREGDQVMSDSQQYTYETDDSAPVTYFTIRRDGSWTQEGQKMGSTPRLKIGFREEYYDYSF